VIEALIAIAGLGLGDYTDPLDLNTEDNKSVIIEQENCRTTTTVSQGIETITHDCQTMKTYKSFEEKD